MNQTNDNNENRNPLELALEQFKIGVQEMNGIAIRIGNYQEEIKKKQEHAEKFNEAVNKGISKVAQVFAECLTYYNHENMDVKAASQKYMLEFKRTMDVYVENFQVEASSHIDNFKKAEISLNEQDRKLIRDSENNFLMYKKFHKIRLWSALSLSLVVFLSGYLAINFYKTSIATKEEVKQEVLSQIDKEGELIVAKNLWKAYQNERFMIIRWSKSNQTDSKSYQTFREGTISAKPKEKIFKNLENNDITNE